MKWAILSDIHGNLPALQAVGKHLRTQKCDNILFTGDITVYYPFSNECIEWLYTNMGENNWKKYAIQGNNDKAVLNDSWKNNQEKEKEKDKTVWWSTKWASESLSITNRDRLKSMATRTIILDEFATVVHGTIDDPLGEIYYMNENLVIMDSLRELDTPIGIFGHTHRAIIHAGKPKPFPSQFSFETQYPEYKLENGVKVYRYSYGDDLMKANKLLVCAGSIGQPRDTDNWSSYLIIDDEEKTFIFFRVDYDRNTVVKELQRYAKENSRVVDKLTNRLHIGA